MYNISRAFYSIIPEIKSYLEKLSSQGNLGSAFLGFQVVIVSCDLLSP